MRYQLHLYWNGACVLEATTTATIAYGTIHAHLRDNFVSDAMPVPGLSKIVAMRAGDVIGGEYGDGNSHAAYKIVRVEA